MKKLRFIINILRVIAYSELVICLIMMFQEMEKRSYKAIGPAIMIVIIVLLLLEMNTMIINTRNDNNDKN